MPKRGADDEETTVSLKKAKHDEDSSGSESGSKNQLKKDNEGNYYLDLGNMKRATVNTFKGKVQMNIREYYTDKSDDVKPGKKGITLNQSQWNVLFANINTLNEKLETTEATNAEERDKKTEEKTKKAKKSEKPTKKKRKMKDESEDEGSDEE